MRPKIKFFIALLFSVIFMSVQLPAETGTEPPVPARAPVMALAPTIPVAQAMSVSAGTGPAELFIPAIGLRDPIVPVGVNAKREMAVPSGKTRNVGWYKNGTVPGFEGSAVLDAHVFAAFASLKRLKVGDRISVTMKDGTKIPFRVYERRTYAISDVPLQRLFNGTGGRYLNLITCAGSLTPDRSTYDHRLVIYAVRAD